MTRTSAVVCGGALAGRAQGAEPPSGVTVGSVSGSSNILMNQSTSHRITDLVALNLGMVRIAAFPHNEYYQGETPTPGNFDAVILALLNAGIRPYFEFEYYSSYNPADIGVPPRTYAAWHAIGVAFATRFQPNSAFLVGQGLTDLGVIEWSAMNEPDIQQGFTSGEYHAILEGLADGIHSVQPGGKVYPGGYANPGRDQSYTANGYIPFIADLINDGTLAGFDIHTYHDRSFAPIHNTYSFSHQAAVDGCISASGITKTDIDWVSTEYNVKADPTATNQNYAALYPGLSHQQVARNWFLTHFFDVHGCVRADGSHAPGIRLAFTAWTFADGTLSMVSQLNPRVERWCGLSYSMLLGLVHDMHFTFNDPKGTGVHKLKGGGKSAWVFQNIHSSWSSLSGTTFTISDIPAGTTQVQKYDGNGLIETVSTPTLGVPSHQFSTPTGKSYLFVGNAE